MGVPLIVLKPFRPGGSGSAELQPGSPFEASGESQERIFRALGWVGDAPIPEPAPEPVKRQYTRKAIEAESAEKLETPEKAKKAEKTDEPDSDRPKRQYQRRDMVAKKTED